MILQAPEPGIVLALPSTPSALEVESSQWNAQFTYGERLSFLMRTDVTVIMVHTATIDLPVTIDFSIPADKLYWCTAQVSFKGYVANKILLSINLPDLNRQEDVTELTKYTA